LPSWDAVDDAFVGPALGGREGWMEGGREGGKEGEKDSFVYAGNDG
jgi:hypothetical protein